MQDSLSKYKRRPFYPNPNSQTSTVNTDLPNPNARMAASDVVSIHKKRGRELTLDLISVSLHLISPCPLSISIIFPPRLSFSLSGHGLRFGKPYCNKCSDLNIVKWDTSQATKGEREVGMARWRREKGAWCLGARCQTAAIRECWSSIDSGPFNPCN